MNEKYILSEEKQLEVYQICLVYQEEYASGHYYIKPTGIKKAAKIIGFDYNILGKERRKEFRGDLIDSVMGSPSRVKNIHYYLRN